LTTLRPFGSSSLKLGDEIQEFYQEFFGKVATAGILTYLRRELAHAIWRLLLDDDLMRAYTDGETIKLFDEVMRAMFPRFLGHLTTISLLDKWNDNDESLPFRVVIDTRRVVNYLEP